MEKFDPYHKWLGIPPEEQPPNHYRLLGINPFESDPDVIDTGAEKQTNYLRTCATGAYVKESQRLLNEVSAARLCLLDAKKKAAYDAGLLAASEASDAPSPDVAALATAAPEIDLAIPKRRKGSSSARSSRGGRSSGGGGLVAGIVVVLLVAGLGVGFLVARRGGGHSDRKVEDGASRVRIAGNPDTASKSSGAADDGTSSNGPGSARRPTGADRKGETPLSLVGEPPSSTRAATENPTPPYRFDAKTEMPVAQPPAVVAAGPEPAVEDVVPAPPKGDELARAEAQVQDIFRNDFANAKKPSDKRALAQKLLANARKSTTDADRAAKYVMLRDAWTTAAESGDAATAHAAIRELADAFDVDAPAMTVEALSTATRVAASADDVKALATAALEAIDEALENEDPEAADKLLALATGAARKIRNEPLLTRVAALRPRIVEEKAAANAAAAARAALESNPDDPAANLALGRYLSFHEQDWEQGLRRLAKSGDPQLARIADLEAAKPTEPARRIQLADAWWAWIEAQPLAERKPLRMAAQYWYALAQPGASGLERVKVDARLAEIGPLETYRTESAESGGPVDATALAGRRSLDKFLRVVASTGIFKGGGMDKLSPIEESGGIVYAKSIKGRRDVICTHPVSRKRKQPAVIDFGGLTKARTGTLVLYAHNDPRGSGGGGKVVVKVDGKTVRTDEIPRQRAWTVIQIPFKYSGLAVEHHPIGWNWEGMYFDYALK